MQVHGNGGLPLRLPDPNSLEYRVQKLVLLELVVDPPAGGDRPGDLAAASGSQPVRSDGRLLL